MIIKNILIGEDIRQELGNKLSLMGILGSSIDIDIKNKPKGIPVGLSLAGLISLETVNSSNDPNNFNILILISLGDTKIADMTAQIETSGVGKSFHISIPRFHLSVTQSSRLLIHASVKKNNDLITENTATLDINLKEN